MEAATPPPPPAPPPEAPPPPPPPAGGASAYPVRVEAQRHEEYNRFLPLVKWLLAFPHYFVLAFLYIGAFFAVVIAWFAVLFTGRYPRGIFDYLVGVGRWTNRVVAYAGILVTDEYPPFRLSA